MSNDNTATFSIGVYSQTAGLITSFFVVKDWDEIDAYIASLQAKYPDCRISAVEDEGYHGQDDGRDAHEQPDAIS